MKKYVRASWVVMVLPHVEQAALYNEWADGHVEFEGDQLGPKCQATLPLLMCPSNPQTVERPSPLHYVVNAGDVDRTEYSLCFDNFHPHPDSPAQYYGHVMGNGLFTDIHWYLEGEEDQTEPSPCTRLCPRDMWDLPWRDKIPQMTLNYLQSKGDGTSQTLMLSENLRTVSWAFQHHDAYDDKGAPRDDKYYFGFCWGQPDVVAEATAADMPKQQRRINGGTSDYDSYRDVPDMKIDDGFPSSNHPGGVYAAFVGGAVKFLDEDIELRVYAQLMTSNHRESELHVGRVWDAKLPAVGSDEF